MRRVLNHAAVRAFFPRSFFSGVGLGSFCAWMRAETRARVAVLRSDRYPLFAVLAATPSDRRPPDRGRIVVVVRADVTAPGPADFLRVIIWIPEPESETSIVFSLAKPENLCECRLRRLPGSLENTGPSRTLFTMKELFLRRRSHWRSADILAFVNVEDDGDDTV